MTAQAQRKPPSSVARLTATLKHVGDRVSWVVSVAIFSVLYFVVFAPTALALKLGGRQYLPVFRGDEPSFFLKRAPVEPTMDYARRQW